MSVEILPFTEIYAESVKQLIINVHQEFGFDYDRRLDVDLDKISHIYGGRGGFCIAIDNGNIIGTSALREDTQCTGTLKRMYLLPPFRGKGIGQMLLRQVIEHAKQQEYEEILLDTVTWQKSAVKLYEKYGFIKTGYKGSQLFYQLTLANR
ncbi:GNAT family N-acetyltransferase [Bacillus sp. SD088]|uniref:GNAT family N-acetyltransferase n=1 Tax=Bacillus sp. SD088 TaxID=2782012 RepID=UPI001A966931|nr:GNAT family N-acetyltransferase [Bacillus sp. SD088]MBO0994534.1 GNAT family N-acetyltransferase [Bacillus sp. SD088]